MTKRSVTSKPNIKFSEIRALEGKQDKGFEELCVQLLPLLIGEKLSRIDRVEGRGGDGGVEAIAVTVSGLHIGLQSKFFEKLDTSQWTQLDKSVRTAIKKHPELTRYIVCVPLDRTPKQGSKWKTLVANWSTLKPTLSVEWAGCSELMGHLIHPDASHFLIYWFGCPEFSFEWVNRQTELAISHLHARYTPLLHQTTSAEQQLGFLCASEKASTEHQQLCSRLVIAWRHAIRKLSEELPKLKLRAPLDEFQQRIDKLRSTLHEGRLTQQGVNLIDALSMLSAQEQVLLDLLCPTGSGATAAEDVNRSFNKSAELRDAIQLTGEVSAAVQKFIKAQKQLYWLLTGEAGSGKSHLLASLAKTLLAEGRSCLLVIAERVASADALAVQLPHLLGWDGSMRELISCLSTHAEITGKSSVLMIDAINESPQRGLWRRELPQLSALIQEFPNVKLLISCRSDCIESSTPSHLSDELARVTHQGFDLHFHEAVKAYFAGYRVVSPQFPTMNSEFQNPLFLKTLCEAYAGRTLPLGSISFVGVLKAWENRIAEQVENQIDCPRQATVRAVNDIVNALAQSETGRVLAEVAEGICKIHFPNPTVSGSLYRHLNSGGLLQEVETSEGIHVRLQYERFSDIRITQSALQGFASKQIWLAHWRSKFLPSIVESGYLNGYAAPRLFAYALLLPESAGIELVECPIATEVHEEWARSQAKEELWSAWLDALSWRSLQSNDTKIIRLFSQWVKGVRDPREIWARLFQFACIPQHPLNADFLHAHLIKMALSKRDSTWTIGLAHENPTDQTGESIVAPFLYWADAAVGNASEEQSRLAVTVLLWLTSSSHRALRDKACDIAIRILVAARSVKVCILQLDEFWEVDDPYVKERLLAVMSGVVPYLDAAAGKQIAELVLARFWQQDVVAPHILQREYAAFIVQHACETGALPKTCLAVLQKTTLISKPSVWSEEQVNRYENITGYGAIASSLRPEEMGHYGDFGRYVMGSKVHNFVDDVQSEPPAKGIGRGGREHDARFARRYIWQRIIEFGWTPERYQTFERGLGYSGRIKGNKVERISKKYQWIGLHEYLGLLSDSLLFRVWDGTDRPLKGAWELWARDYDPSAALGNDEDVVDEDQKNPTWWDVPSPVGEATSLAEKQAWVASDFTSFEPYLRVRHNEKNWVVLHLHGNFEEDLGFGVERFKAAQMAQWIDARAFLLPKSQLQEKLATLRSKDFYGDGCDIPEAYQCWITEYPWHSTLLDADEHCQCNETWVRDLKLDLFLPVCGIPNDSKHVLLPAPLLYRQLNAVFSRSLSSPRFASDGSIAVFDNTGQSIIQGSAHGTRVLIVDEVVLRRCLESQGYALVWAVLSEKSAWDGSDHVGGLARQSAVYVLQDDGGISGGLTNTHEYVSPEK